jgi:hypothetical protein
MAEYKVGSAATSSMSSTVGDISISTKTLDIPGQFIETGWINPNFPKYLGFYKMVPEVKAATDIMTHWVIGDGYISEDAEVQVILDHISGWGTDTFDDIIENMDKLSRINGDSFAEVIRDESGVLLNIKPLDPSSIKIVVDDKGRIERYEQIADGKIEKLSREKIFHLTNKRVGNEIHGTSDYESVEGIIKALNESFEDTKVIVHRNVVPLRVIEVDLDDETQISALAAKYETMIKNKEVLFIPKGVVKVETQGLPNNATFNPLPWRETLKNQFYQMIGVPQMLMGGAAEFSESSAKIVYLAFERTVRQRQRYIITQVWNQLGLRIDLDVPASLQNDMISDTKKDGSANRLNFQPNDTTAGVGQ